MANNAPPRIFSPSRRKAARLRMRQMQAATDAPRYILDDMVEDVQERLAFLRHEPSRALVIGDWSGELTAALVAKGCLVTNADVATGQEGTELDEEQPYPFGPFDLVASLGTLDTVNDLPGALVHIRNALAPGGLAIASFIGAGSLLTLRGAMLAADEERPAARIHPMVDVRSGGQLLQRVGWAQPVVDSRTLTARFGSLDRLVEDLRAQGLSNVLASPGPILTRAMRDRAHAAFLEAADADGRVPERFEILTLSGWRI
ncbi:methyltransferase [Croceicoccus estronivorus]|uniref:methyltransferase domain-containing protein n=1 Tax=Croceicoccus estronivorus TaxID=1172626 RepID=UPI00083057AA|nr:methyltransferase domain-containing protein [Croceicoccus estronivorus]OCC24576.1 methyltransferase [Croceicoccus estronivorus]